MHGGKTIKPNLAMPLSLSAFLLHPALGILIGMNFSFNQLVSILLPVAPQKTALHYGHQKYWVVNEYEDA
jgi:hypothetical protein